MVTAEKVQNIGGITAQGFQRAAVLFSVGFGSLGLSKKLDKSLIEVDAEDALIHASKTLLDCPEVDAISTLDSGVRDFLWRRTLPSPFKKGLFLLPIALLEEVDERLVAHGLARAAAVEALIAVYTERVEDARVRLRAAFDARDYPSVERVRTAYWFTFQYLQLDAASNLPASIREREQNKISQIWDEAAQGVRDVLRAALLEMVGGLAEKLTGERDGGKPKIFRDSSVSKLHEFVQTFQARNITNDAECAALVERVRLLVDGVEPQALRDDSSMREQVRTGFTAISTELGALMTEQPKLRLFRLED